MFVLIAAGILVPVFLKRIPLPFRIESSFMDLVAATAIALFLRQTRQK
jgi:hypothetical protein